MDDLKICLKNLELESKEFIFIPVNDINNKYNGGGGNHWSLLIYQKKNNEFFYLDSMNSFINNTHIIVKNLKTILNIENTQNGEITDIESCKIQQNTYDCGMFVLAFTEAILNQLEQNQFKLKLDETAIENCLRSVNQKEIKSKRKKILELIENLRKNNNY